MIKLVVFESFQVLYLSYVSHNFMYRICHQVTKAIQFATESGLVLTLGGDDSQSQKESHVMKFECELFSNYPEERETLFFGGATKLKIKDIKQIDNGKWSNYGRSVCPRTCNMTKE